MRDLTRKNNAYNSPFFNKLKEINGSNEEQKDERSFPLFKAKDNFENLILELDKYNDVLKDLFYELGNKGIDLTTSERNKVIEDIISNIDKVEEKFEDLKNDLEKDKTSIKGLSLINRNNLKEFDSIFNQWE